MMIRASYAARLDELVFVELMFEMLRELHT